MIISLENLFCSSFEWPLKTGFTVYHESACKDPSVAVQVLDISISRFFKGYQEIVKTMFCLFDAQINLSYNFCQIHVHLSIIFMTLDVSNK